MMKQRLSRVGLGVAALGATFALAACGGHPTPQPYAEVPPPQGERPPPVLLGELEGTSQATQATPGYTSSAPPAYAQQQQPAPQAPAPVIIAMAPIPNPPERGKAEPRIAEARPAPVPAPARRPAPTAAPAPRTYAEARPAPVPVRRPAPVAPVAKAETRPEPKTAPFQTGSVAPREIPRLHPVAPHEAAPAKPAPAKPTQVAKAHPKATPAHKPEAQVVAKAQAPAAHVKPAPQPKLAQARPVPKLNPAAPTVKEPAETVTATANATAAALSPLSDRATRLAAFETSLSETVRRTGKLTLPNRFVANQPADVTLTLPAPLSDTVRDAAAKNQLTDAAAAVNLTAMLSGEGYVVTPGAALSQPLVPGQATEFHWTVNALPGARGKLQAEIGADLLGAGSETLNLGSVQAAPGGGLSPRLLGGLVLVLLAALVIGFLARNPSARARPAEVRRRQPVNLRDEPGRS